MNRVFVMGHADLCTRGGSASFTPTRITQRIWCPLYIDALIATQTDTTGADPGPGADGDFTDASSLDTLYAVCDRKYDVIAMTDSAGILKERTDYSPYGVARQRPPADLNGDGKIDGVDQLIFFNAWGASLGSGVYNPDADINFDGQVNGDDFLILNNAFGADPAPPGAVSQHGNTVGYSGYIYDDAIGMSLARFRWYDAETGRWATRDPAEYSDSMNLYIYANGDPLLMTDPYGLFGLPDLAPYLLPGIYHGFKWWIDYEAACYNPAKTGPTRLESPCEAFQRCAGDPKCSDLSYNAYRNLCEGQLKNSLEGVNRVLENGKALRDWTMSPGELGIFDRPTPNPRGPQTIPDWNLPGTPWPARQSPSQPLRTVLPDYYIPS